MIEGQWYRDGTVSVVSGGTAVTGTGTLWDGQVRPGDLFTVDGERLHEVAEVRGDGAIVIRPAWAGRALKDASYAIIRVWGRTMPEQIAAQGSQLLHELRRKLAGQTLPPVAAGAFLRGTAGADGWETCSPEQLRADIVPFATAEETEAGEIDTKAVTPAGLQAVLPGHADEDGYGLTAFATVDQTLAGDSDDWAVHPKGLKAAVDAAVDRATRISGDRIKALETLAGTLLKRIESLEAKP